MSSFVFNILGQHMFGIDDFIISRQKINFKSQSLQLLNQHIEAFRYFWPLNLNAFDNALISFSPAVNIITFNGQHFLKAMGRTVGFQSPNFHFTKALAAVLGLTAQRLLRNHSIWAGGTSMNLIGYHMIEFNNVHTANSGSLGKWFTSPPITKLLFT